MKKNLVVLLTLGMLCGCQEKKDDNVVRIACNLPMTGDCAIYGESVKNGYEMALSDLDIFLKKNDIRVEIDYQDNKCSNKEALTIAQKQLMRKNDIYVSGITQQTYTIEEKVTQQGIPHFIWSFYPLLMGNGKNMVRTWVNLPSEPFLFKEYLESKPNAKKIACVYLNAASGVDLFNKIFIPLIESDYEIVYNEAFDIEGTNFKNVALKVKKTNPDVIFVNGFQNHIIQLAKEFNNNAMKKDGNIVFTFDLLDAMNDVESHVLNGYVANIPEYIVNPTSEFLEWKFRYKEIYSRDPNYTDAYAYDCMHVICNALAQHKNDSIKKDLLNYIQDTELPGITGLLTFEKNGNLNSQSKICIVDEGKLIPINM